MHILVLDHNRTNGLAQAMQLSGYGLIVETVPTLDEAERRLSVIALDAVLCNFQISDAAQIEKLETLRKLYPDTDFIAVGRLDEFLKRIGKTGLLKSKANS